MSFAQQVKTELTAYDAARRESGEEPSHCRHAEQYGLFVFCRNFSRKEMGIKTEYKEIAQMYAAAACEMSGKKAAVVQTSAGKYRVEVDTLHARESVLSTFGYSGQEVTRRLNRANLDFDCCNGALIRGAFLSCGTITDPEKDYHLEFVLSHKVLCDDLMKLMTELEFNPKYVVRNGAHIIYFKDSESIEDLLTLMGATESSLELMGTKMYKDMRNKVNRRMNFENANSSRAFDAAYREVEAIRYIEERKGLAYLAPELRELAKLRLDNVEYTLSDLADHLQDPISKSGVNHRMKRILQTAEELKSQAEKEER